MTQSEALNRKMLKNPKQDDKSVYLEQSSCLNLNNSESS